jgi:CRISPR-associated endonuclease Cas1
MPNSNSTGAHVDSVPEHIRQTFTREPADRRVIVVDGYGIKLTTKRGELVIEDGIGTARRVRVVPRVTNVQRVIILAPNGYITLGASEWCAATGVQLLQLTRDGSAVMAGSQERTADVTLIRAQSSTTADTSLAIVKALLTVKLEKQAKVLCDVLGASLAASRTERELARVGDATTIDAARRAEARGAATYWGSWQGRAEPRFARGVQAPDHWRAFDGGRNGLIRDSKRHASNPVNALLNFAYSLAYAESRLVCLASGLDPRLGYLHSDANAASGYRDSLALDIMETVRPDVDRYILDLLNSRVFDGKAFTEANGRGDVPAGTCRILAPLTHELAESVMGIVREPLQETAETVRAMLLGKKTARRAPVRVKRQTRDTDMRFVAELVPDDLWEKVRPLIPVRQGTTGPRPVDDRVCLALILMHFRDGVPWKRLPVSRCGTSEGSVRHRLRLWEAEGAWDAIAQAAGFSVANR